MTMMTIMTMMTMMMMIMTSPENITIEDTNNENHDDNRKPVFVMMIVMGTMGTNVRTTKRHNNDTDNDNYGDNHGETQDGGELSSRRKTLGGGMGESSMCRSFTAGGIIIIIIIIITIIIIIIIIITTRILSASPFRLHNQERPSILQVSSFFERKKYFEVALAYWFALG